MTTDTHDGGWVMFKLGVVDTKPRRVRLVKDREALLRVMLAKSPWTQRDFARFLRVFTKYADTTFPGTFDEDFYFEAERAVKEWDRIASAKPFPSTAEIRRELSRPERAVRAVSLHDRIVEKVGLRMAVLRPTMKTRKTRAAIVREENRVFGGDAELRRLQKSQNRLRAVVPNLQSLVYAARRTGT